MFCKNCGAHISDESKFCYKCGTPTPLAEQKDQIGANDYDPFDTPPTASYNPAPQPQPQAQPQQHPQSSAADEGVFGLLGFIMAFFFPLLGLIFSIIGMNKKKNSGLALAGFIISLVFIIIVVIAIIVVVENSHPYYYYY